MSKNFSNASLYQNRYELSADADEKFEATASEPFTPAFMIAQPRDRKPNPRKRWFAAREVLDKSIQAATGLLKVEWNFSKHPQYPNREIDDAGLHFRVATFFRAVVAAPEKTRRIRRLFNKGFSGRGVDSPYTEQYFLWKAVAAYGSAVVIDKQLRKTIGRANTILEPYGLKVSNTALRASLGKKSRSHKAGKRAAMLTLQEVLGSAFGVRVSVKEALFVGCGFAAAIKASKVVRQWMGSRIEAGEFKNLREALAASSRLVIDRTDGVEAYSDPATEVKRGPVTATLAWRKNRDRPMIWVVKNGERTYHAYVYTVWEDGENRIDDRQPFREAIEAWRQQDEAARQAKEVIAVPDNVTLIVWKSDSYAVGNCDPGTREFMRRIGIDPDRELAVVQKMLPFVARNWRAMNTLKYAARQLRQQLDEQQLRLAS